MIQCPVCLNGSFGQFTILKDRLIAEWELIPFEVDYINKQQGFHCDACFCNLRSMTLASAIMKEYNYKGSFKMFPYSRIGKRLKLLEVNEAGGLHSTLALFKNYTLAKYPAVDLQCLPYSRDSFDLIVHSDTLEHVENSFSGLKECYRVLKPGGKLFYTIPIIYGRLTRSRGLLTDSYHGSQGEEQGSDYIVRTEYGADFWVEVVKAGFTKITLTSLNDLSSIAICTEKELNSLIRRGLYDSSLVFYERIKRKILQILK